MGTYTTRSTRSYLYRGRHRTSLLIRLWLWLTAR